MRTRAFVLAVALVACGGRTNEIEHAKSVRYDAALPLLVAETAEVVRTWYNTVEVDPRGTIRTSWQQVPRPHQDDGSYDTRTIAARMNRAGRAISQTGCE